MSNSGNRKFGNTIREGRNALGLSQQELARKVGVQASYIAYIENDRRRPSLPVLRRIARVLSLNPREMFFLSHPEARHLLEEKRPAAKSRSKDEAWRQFRANHALLKRHNVTPAELRMLKQVSMLSSVSSPRHFFFILNAIRQAADDEDC